MSGIPSICHVHALLQRRGFVLWILTPIPQNEVTRQEEPRVLVQSEDEPDKILLETRICKEDSFQKQQGTEDWQALLEGLC